ncbi:MAG: hypothetical protein H0W96_09010 [Solirubrobacterales bacterium]|nr:hypothetical protein [Solirubrobacterales bacterium]
MRTLKTSEAAALLNVRPNTLRAWELRTTGARILPDRPFGAQRRLLAFVDDRRDERAVAALSAPPLRAAGEIAPRTAQA